MKLKALLICITLFSASFLSAQDDFQGVATYMSKTTMDMDGFGGKDMSPERKKAISERMKSMLEKTYVLTFNKTESTYKEDEKLSAPGAGGGRFGGMMSSFTAGPQYKNIKDGQLIQDQEFFGKQFLIKDDLEKLEWKMTGETKQIGKYMVMKAVATKKVNEMDFSKLRRRGPRGGGDKEKKKEETVTKGDRAVSAFGKGEVKAQEGEKSKESSEVASTEEKTTIITDEIEIPKEEEVVAWYTMQIPVNNGPSDFWGLPGLILEINSGRTTILCSKIVMNPAEKQDIKKPSKGKEVTKAEYNDIVKNKMEEMREMYGGRNRGGRGGRH